MKIYIFLLLAFLTIKPAIAQNDNFGKLNISVVVPQEQEGFSTENLSMLATKLTVLLTNTGIASGEIDNGIVLYPIIKIYNEREIQPGLQKMVIIDAEMSLFIKKIDDKYIFGSTTTNIQGSGRTHLIAINNLLSAIKTDNKSFDEFIAKTKDRILNYYTQKCSTILTQAEQLANVGKQAEAFSLIMSIPVDVPCYNEARKKAFDIYTKYQTKICTEVLQAAKAKFATKNFKEGFELLNQIDPSSKCTNEVKTLFKVHAKEVDDVEKREFDLQQKIISNAFELEKYRLKSIADISQRYLNNRQEYSYDIVIR